MTDPIQRLMGEHQLILSVLDGLEHCANELRGGVAVPMEDCRGFITFIQEFADKKHHAKEEEILFQEMVGCGFPQQGGPIAVMLEEHDIGRQQVSTMRSALDDGAWTGPQRDTFSEAALGFCDLLRMHIYKEDYILYPMASQRLPQEAMARIEQRCDADELTRKQSGETARLEALAAKLIKRYAN